MSSADQKFLQNDGEMTEEELMTTYKQFMRDPKNVDIGAAYLLETLIDEAILSLVFEIHKSYKTGSLSALEGQEETKEEIEEFRIVNQPNVDIFGVSSTKKVIDCTCPNCDRLVAASRFAPHLEKCMGMGRNSARTASKRIASRDLANSSSALKSNESIYTDSIDDDDNDTDWQAEKRKKKAQPSRNNGSKRKPDWK